MTRGTEIAAAIAPYLAELSSDPQKALSVAKRIQARLDSEIEELQAKRAMAQDASLEAAMMCQIALRIGKASLLEDPLEAIEDNERATEVVNTRLRDLEQVAEAHRAAIAGIEARLRKN